MRGSIQTVPLDRPSAILASLAGLHTDDHPLACLQSAVCCMPFGRDSQPHSAASYVALLCSYLMALRQVWHTS